MQQSAAASVLRSLAVINCIVGVIGSIIFSWSAFGGRWGSTLAFLLVLFISLLGVALVTAICFTLAEAADDIAATRYNSYSLLRNHELDKAAANPQKNTSNATHVKNTPVSKVEKLPDGWRCNKCDDKNLPTAVSCRSCGAYK